MLYTEYTDLAKKPKLFHQKDREEQDALYSPNVFNKYLFNLFLNMFILVAKITSSDKLFHWPITLLPKLHFKTSLFTLSLYNFIECPLVFAHRTLKKQSPFIPSFPFNILKTSNISALTLLVSNVVSPNICILSLYDFPLHSSIIFWKPSFALSLVSQCLSPGEASKLEYSIPSVDRLMFYISWELLSSFWK